MIALSGVSKHYGRRALLVDATFQLNPGEKVGLVGPNGSGKSTIFRLLMGEETADDGEVSVPKRVTVGYFRQDASEASGRSVIDEAIAGSGRLGDLHHELKSLEAAMSDPEKADKMDEILARFGEVQGEYLQLGGYELEARAREVLAGLGFREEQVDGDVGLLSGGWRMRVSIAKVLIGEPEVLLLDEPTNHLDIESILWLEQFLRNSKSAVLMTCHDRDFMNRVVTRLLEIDNGELVNYGGNYDFYEREREVRAAQQEAAFTRQQAMLKKEERFIERFERHAAKAAQVQSRVKKREKIENLALLLSAAIHAQGRVGLMLNVPSQQLPQVLSLLPALQQPTVSALSDPAWVAVNTILEEKTVRDLIPRLKAAGGQGIVEYPLNKIVV